MSKASNKVKDEVEEYLDECSRTALSCLQQMRPAEAANTIIAYLNSVHASKSAWDKVKMWVENPMYVLDILDKETFEDEDAPCPVNGQIAVLDRSGNTYYFDVKKDCKSRGAAIHDWNGCCSGEPGGYLILGENCKEHILGLERVEEGVKQFVRECKEKYWKIPKDKKAERKPIKLKIKMSERVLASVEFRIMKIYEYLREERAKEQSKNKETNEPF